MTPSLVALILFGSFLTLIILRIPVAFALALACLPVFLLEPRLTPILLLRRCSSYNSFVLLAVPFFLLAANLMNAAGITERLIGLARAMVGHLPGGLGQVNVLVRCSLPASPAADRRCCRDRLVLIPRSEAGLQRRSRSR